MKNDAITPEQWAEQRRKWERDAAYSYGKAASELGVSKQRVGKVASREGWQKSIAASAAMNKHAPPAGRKVTENLPQSPSRAPSVDGQSTESGLAAPLLNKRAAPIDIPSNLTDVERQELIEKAVLARQVELNRTQAIEIKAAKKGVYDALRAAGKEGAYDAARSAKAVTEGIRLVHASEAANEIERVKLELGLFSGVRPAACKIIVHQVPGVIFDGDNSPEAVARRQGFALGQAASIEAGRIRDEAEAGALRKAEWEVTDVEST